LEKKGEEKLAENTVKECRNNHEELRNEWKKRQKFLDKGSDRERTIKNPDGTETRVSTRKKMMLRKVIILYMNSGKRKINQGKLYQVDHLF
jgi:hypothetical protein